MWCGLVVWGYVTRVAMRLMPRTQRLWTAPEALTLRGAFVRVALSDRW